MKRETRRKWVTRFRNVATRKPAERKIKIKDKKSAKERIKPWFGDHIVEPLIEKLQWVPFLRREPTTGEREIFVNDRERNKQFKFKENQIRTTKYGPLTFLPKNLYEVSDDLCIPQPFLPGVSLVWTNFCTFFPSLTDSLTPSFLSMAAIQTFSQSVVSYRRLCTGILHITTILMYYALSFNIFSFSFSLSDCLQTLIPLSPLSHVQANLFFFSKKISLAYSQHLASESCGQYYPFSFCARCHCSEGGI